MGTSEIKRKIAQEAVRHVKDGMIVGLGTGSTSELMVEELGKRVREGLAIQAVATSIKTERLAENLGIPLISLEEVKHLDLIIDGIDQIDPGFSILKGGGGALFREKIVALYAREVIYMADESKFVARLQPHILPVEIEPFGYRRLLDVLHARGVKGEIRRTDGKPFITDGGNWIIDVSLQNIPDVRHFSREMKLATGVIETGYFERQPDLVVTYRDGEIVEMMHPSLRRGGGPV